MIKELEAIKVLKANAILFDDGTDYGASMLEAISQLDEALTPPTADEVWKPIKNYEDKYIVSNYGRVKSLSRMVPNKNGERIVNEKYSSININNRGYCQVSLTTNHKSKLCFVHRLVVNIYTKPRK